MIKKHHLSVVILLLCSGTIFLGLNPCMTTFINDGKEKVLIVHKNDNNIFFVPKNGRRRFGSHHEHALFDIYMQQPKSQVFRPIYRCQQNQCGKSGNPQIKFSDIENSTGETGLFVIIKNNKPHTSMVRELPMIRKKICASCHD